MKQLITARHTHEHKAVEEIVTARQSDSCSHLSQLAAARERASERVIWNEQSFRRMISLERKRSERSGKPFLLILLDIGKHFSQEESETVLGNVGNILSQSMRETDVTGWYEEHTIVGVMFTEIGLENRSSLLNTLLMRVSEALHTVLSFEQFNRISISFHVFPEDWDRSANDGPSNPQLYPDLIERENARKSLRVIKRAMDLAGSVSALIFLAPVFLTIALAIKLTSKGPVFFRQRRVGQYGVLFSLLKFRSMYADSDSKLHKEYMQRLIAGRAELHQSKIDGGPVYKLTNDSRITAVGAFLRRTSLDELPQLINVVKGEMSLVGPRPPIDYEVARYDLWHRRRLIEAKPGITGLWQVTGRNRIPFDDMVRLDLKYAKSWSPWLDLKILLLTPKAVVEGAH